MKLKAVPVLPLLAKRPIYVYFTPARLRELWFGTKQSNPTGIQGLASRYPDLFKKP